MLKTCATPVLRAIWRGRKPNGLHPKVVHAVRQHLSVLHAAMDIEDVKQAFGDRLERCDDPSIPFPESPLKPKGSGPEEDSPEPVSADTLHWWRVHVGYGWWLSFDFEAGEAWRVDLACGREAELLR